MDFQLLFGIREKVNQQVTNHTDGEMNQVKHCIEEGGSWKSQNSNAISIGLTVRMLLPCPSLVHHLCVGLLGAFPIA